MSSMSSREGAKKEMVKLKSSDGELFDVEVEVVAAQSQTIKDAMDCSGGSTLIPVDRVSSKTLAEVLEFCGKQAGMAGVSEEVELKQWNARFVSVLDKQALFHLLEAANFLNIQSLLDVTCQRVAELLVSKPPEEVRSYFEIANDFTPEEEAQLRQENQWAFL
ncbi:hypothetical protein L7F22_012589 [Adiantum nelumboides]|nr:hypothetical protein [Adiantum nelumboides]